jgi:hypothetical protein
MPASPSERSLQAKLAVETSWAQTSDPTARTQPARSAFRERFEREVDPEGKLAPQERARRAEHARRAHYARLALLSAQSKRRKRDAARKVPAGRRESNNLGGES